MKQLRLIESDYANFKDWWVEVPSGIIDEKMHWDSNQYLDHDDCPIARTLKRMGFNNVKVFTYDFIVDGHTYNMLSDLNVLVKAATRIRAGAKYAIIKVHK